MRYRTVKELIDFAIDLSANDETESLSTIYIEFYNGDLVGTFFRNMYSDYINLLLNNKDLLLYLIDELKILESGTVITFAVTIKKPPSI